MSKIIKICTFLTFFLIILLIYLVAFPHQCFKKPILYSFKDLGVSVFYDCFSKKDTERRIKYRIRQVNKILKIDNQNYANENNKNKNLNFDFSETPKVSKIKKYKQEKIKIISKNDFKDLSDNQDIDYKSWSRSHANNYNNKFYDTKIINKNNINKIKLKWKYSSVNQDKIEEHWKQNIQANPVYADGMLYFISSDWSFNALKADTGELLWKKKFFHPPSRRGFLWIQDELKKNSYILISSGKRLFKINSKNGKIIKEFGSNGSIFTQKVIIAPVVYNNLIIVSDVIDKNISAYNFISGKKVFSHRIHPEKENFHGSPWSGAALDSATGMYYLVTGNPKPSLYGANRLGENKNSNSLIAFDIQKQKITWSFQEVSHDLWDFDLASPPILANLKINSKLLEVVIVTTKIGNTFIFERNTGKTLFDIKYKEAPKSTVHGEVTSKLQIKNTIPENFSEIEFKLSDLRESVLKKRKFVANNILNTKYGWFVPPGLDKPTITYGVHGGSQWHGSVLDPFKNTLFIPTNHIPYKLRMFPRSLESKDFFTQENNKHYASYALYQKKCASCHGSNRNGQQDVFLEKEISYLPSLVGLSVFPSMKKKLLNYGDFKSKHQKMVLNKKQYNEINNLFKYWDKKLINKKLIDINEYWVKLLDPKDDFPVNKPPWGEIVALNVLTGKILYRIPFGYAKDSSGEFKNIGTNHNGGIALTSAGLIFANGTLDSYAAIFNSDNGKELWKYKMTAPGSSPPIIYNYNNKQYVGFLSTGLKYHNSKKKSSTLYVFSLDN